MYVVTSIFHEASMFKRENGVPYLSPFTFGYLLEKYFFIRECLAYLSTSKDDINFPLNMDNCEMCNGLRDGKLLEERVIKYNCDYCESCYINSEVVYGDR